MENSENDDKWDFDVRDNILELHKYGMSYEDRPLLTRPYGRSQVV